MLKTQIEYLHQLKEKAVSLDYSMELSKKKLATDIELLLKVYMIPLEKFLAGSTVKSISLAREYNKCLCRMHMILENFQKNVSIFPGLETQVYRVLTNKKYQKLLEENANTETGKILTNLRKNCQKTLGAFLIALETDFSESPKGPDSNGIFWD